MSKLIITRGIPASGKSKWAKQWVLEDPEHRVRFNNDDIRNMLGKYWVPSREPMVAAMKDSFVEEAILLRLDMVVDNTNLNNKEIEYWKNWANLHNYDLEYKDFFDTPLSVCIERDKTRDPQVSEKIIRNFYNNYKDIYPLNGR